jgi:hypothetical protein
MESLLRPFLQSLNLPFEYVIHAAASIDEVELPGEDTLGIVYPISLQSDFHFHEHDGERIKYREDYFKLDDGTPHFFDGLKLVVRKGNLVCLQFLSNDISRKLLVAVLNDAVKVVSGGILEKGREQFKTAMTSAIEFRIKEFKSNIETNEDEAKTHEQEALNMRNSIVTDKEAIKALDGTKGQWIHRAEDEFDHLQHLVPSFYKKISLNENELIALTYPIEIEFDGAEYYLGDFEVKIGLQEAGLVIHNLTKQIDGYDHPHVNDGSACLGNISTGLIKMLAEFEFFGALQMIHTFLHSYNSDSPYLTIDHWDPNYTEDTRSHFEECHDDNSGYRCVECGGEDGRCPFYEYAFSDCFEESTLADCIKCDYQCHLGRERIKRHEAQQQPQAQEVTQ